MFRWNPLFRTSFGMRREQPKARRRQKTAILNLEALEDRALLSVSAGNPLTTLSLASPPPVSSVAAVESYVRSTLDQWVATVQQDVSGLWKALGQEIAQGVSIVEQQWARLFGFNPNAQNSTNTATSGAGSDSGTANAQGNSKRSDSGSSTVHSAPTVVVPHAPSPSSRMTPMSSPPISPPPQEWVYLSSSSYTVNEDAGSVAVQVDLLAATSNTVSVELTTSDGTALSGIDYSSVDTEVVFQPGTTSQTVNIPIIDDGTSDDSAGSESFSVQLSNASGAPLAPPGAQPTSATVTIQENNSPPPPPPGGAVSGTVWQDSDDDGIMQPGEPGQPGRPVELIYGPYPTNMQLGYVAYTDSNGNYSFDFSLVPTGWSFEIMVPLLGWVASPEDASSTGIVSNVDENGESSVFTMNGGEDININAGLFLLQQSTDTLVWNPKNGNNASTVTNWYDQTLSRQLLPIDPGPGSGTPVIFDGTPNSQTPNDDSPIDWDKGFTVASMTIENGYTAQQTLFAGVNLELLGAAGEALGMDDPSQLNFQFDDHNQVLQIDNGGTITNMNITGYSDDTLDITGGSTQIGTKANYTENVGVGLLIETDATLYHGGQCSLNMTANNLVIEIRGRMSIMDGPGAGITSINNNGNTGGYIDVNDGTLRYNGKKGVTDTINIPVFVENGGTFVVSNLVPALGSPTLVVKDSSNYVFPNGLKESVYMTASNSSVQLANGATLECDDDYYQAAGTLMSMDVGIATLKDGPAGAGTATIAAGSGLIVDFAGSDGTVSVKGNLKRNRSRVEGARCAAKR